MQDRDQKGPLMSADYSHPAKVDLDDWPGRDHGLSAREAEIVALITQGLSNEQIADRMFLSVNTVKSYIRSAYQKMRVNNRARAVLWGVDHGFRPTSNRANAPEAVH